MVGESDGVVYLRIDLSNRTSLSIDLTVEILTNGINATGKWSFFSKHIVML